MKKWILLCKKPLSLGLTITPLFTEYCNVKLKNDRLESRMQHWQVIAIGASEQSGRIVVPQILGAKALEHWLINDEITNCDLRLILQPGSRRSIADFIGDYAGKKPRSISLLVGPEGGISNVEFELVKKHNFVPVRLGPRTSHIAY